MEKKLFKEFINRHAIETKQVHNIRTGKEDIMVFIPFENLHELCKLYGDLSFDHKTIPCEIEMGRLIFWSKDLLLRENYEWKDVFNNIDHDYLKILQRLKELEGDVKAYVGAKK